MMGPTIGIADIFEGAAEFLEREGAWGQARRGGQIGLHCAATAITHTGDVRGVPEVARHAKRHLAEVLGGTNSNAIWNWNDAAGRTQAEVVAKLREVAAQTALVTS